LIRAATVRRPSNTVVVLRVPASAVRLPPGAFGWAVRTTWSSAGCPSTAACRDASPDHGSFNARLRRVEQVGCRVSGRAYRSNGSRARRVVALTFDDGPAPITPRFLHVLERKHVPATFFVLGRQIHGHEALLRRMLRDGFALGDHTMTHANVSGGGPATEHEVRGPIPIIKRATGYRPCLFRAPYGAVSSRLIARARALAMATIQWNVDPRDWSRPGAGAIESRILSQTRPGSIIIMHDGGGPRGQTLAALPHVIDALRARGYRFATVPHLLGYTERMALR
jgi:peptidoglycan/xylan/chitin deacetylase (PgdA/CDA1 family)